MINLKFEVQDTGGFGYGSGYAVVGKTSGSGDAFLALLDSKCAADLFAANLNAAVQRTNSQLADIAVKRAADAAMEEAVKPEE